VGTDLHDPQHFEATSNVLWVARENLQGRGDEKWIPSTLWNDRFIAGVPTFADEKGGNAVQTGTDKKRYGVWRAIWEFNFLFGFSSKTMARSDSTEAYLKASVDQLAIDHMLPILSQWV